MRDQASRAVESYSEAPDGKALTAHRVKVGIGLAVLIVALLYGVRDQMWDLLKQAGPSTIALNVAGIALGAAERVVQASLDAEVHGHLIDAYIDEVAGSNG